jgi:sugar transferase (PEP-CTERM/EpsH1 system associated)
MDLLFLSHCVPNPPDKGERIRSHFEVRKLAERHNVHLVCFGASVAELEALDGLRDVCASMHGEALLPRAVLPKMGLRFLAGSSLNRAYYDSSSLRRHVTQLAARVPFSAAVAFSVVMAPYVPAGVPYVLDMLDVDSEKWFEYARQRRPGFLYAMEGRRMRRMEIEYALQASRTFLTTRPEEALFCSVAPRPLPTGAIENGVDFEYYDPAAAGELPELAGRRFLLFVGSMGYFPNAAGVIGFARSVFPELRKRTPGLEFFIVGRNAGGEVLALQSIPGVTVTGGVPDTRPYLKHCLACVAPLEIARGIQNKVLEALAMGKQVLSSSAICKTFGDEIPAGVLRCDTAEQYGAALDQLRPDARLRDAARRRFTWHTNLQPLVEAVEIAAAIPV